MKGTMEMYNNYNNYPCAYPANIPMYIPNNMYNNCNPYPCPYYINPQAYYPYYPTQFPEDYIPFPEKKDNKSPVSLKDYGPNPFVVNIEDATKQNNNFRTALWTGEHLQLTLMSINVGEDIGLEIHPNTDQFIRIEEGQGLVKMGDKRDKLDFEKKVSDDSVVIIPAGKWHNLINTGNKPLKLYSIYAPPQHPHGTVHKTKAEAEEAERCHC